MRVFAILILFLVAISCCAQENWTAPEESKNIVNPYEGNTIAAQKGQKLYSKLCWTCHGKNGLGDGPAGAGLNPKPKSFADKDVQMQSDGELFWKLSNGKGMMVPYKHSLNEEMRWQLINYIRTLKADK
jgi:mono/diheme cytochrome c family protein